MPDHQTPRPIAAILESDWFWLLTRIIASFMFWITAVQWAMQFDMATGAAGSVGLSPVGLWGAVLIAFYAIFAILIILDRWLWLAAGAFGVFIVLTILLVHHFWTMPPAEAQQTWLEVKEHITVIGGLMALALASHLRRRLRA